MSKMIKILAEKLFNGLHMAGKWLWNVHSQLTNKIQA